MPDDGSSAPNRGQGAEAAPDRRVPKLRPVVNQQPEVAAMQAIGFPGAIASAAKIAFRSRFKDAFAKPGRRRGRIGLWECGQSRPRTRHPNANANKDCPHAFHALRAAVNEKQPNDPKRSKNRDAVRVYHWWRTNRIRRSLENAKTRTNPQQSAPAAILPGI